MEGYDFRDKRVYLSGPMTGMPGRNRAAFDAAEDRLRASGAARVWNPADLAPLPGEAPWPHERYMLRTLSELTMFWPASGGIAPEYDAIALLPGWEKSGGARAERAVAEACGIEVIELG